MNALAKVLVVDNGQRSASDLLSTELAELGLASVTASLEAAGEVLGMIERPSAIVLNMTEAGRHEEQTAFAQLVRSLRDGSATRTIPVIEWRPESVLQLGGLSAILRSEVGPLAGTDSDP